jgi:hypothetical protein
MQIVLYAIIGLLGGLLSGVFGIGGGILVVPALIFAAGFSQQRAQGTSLVALLGPVGLLAFIEYWKKGETDVTAGVVIAAMLFVGAYFGSKVSLGLPEPVMRRSFAAFLALIALWLFLRK